MSLHLVLNCTMQLSFPIVYHMLGEKLLTLRNAVGYYDLPSNFHYQSITSENLMSAKNMFVTWTGIWNKQMEIKIGLNREFLFHCNRRRLEGWPGLNFDSLDFKKDCKQINEYLFILPTIVIIISPHSSQVITVERLSQ